MTLFSTHASFLVKILGLGFRDRLKCSAAGRLALGLKAGENSFG